MCLSKTCCHRTPLLRRPCQPHRTQAPGPSLDHSQTKGTEVPLPQLLFLAADVNFRHLAVDQLPGFINTHPGYRGPQLVDKPAELINTPLSQRRRKRDGVSQALRQTNSHYRLTLRRPKPWPTLFTSY